jgi:PTH1 family peptidyl-tRNA hydrolase
MAWLVAGLGNPGRRYARTRHNAGRMVVEILAHQQGTRLKKLRFLPVEAATVRWDDDEIWLVTSTRYMNEAGAGYASFARKHRIDPQHVIAVHDEIEIPAGALRVKLGGGSAGHNGLKSLTQGLRSPDYHRVRVGVGRPPGRQDPSDFVLEPITKEVEAELVVWVDRAADAVRSLVRDGLEATQQRFNRAAGS